MQLISAHCARSRCKASALASWAALEQPEQEYTSGKSEKEDDIAAPVHGKKTTSSCINKPGGGNASLGEES
jgi:hypothetical protein